ncbi:MAG: MFS transporter [bacterium]|nr:MFS transporter [bacterium]
MNRKTVGTGNKLKLSTKIGYGLGDIYGGGALMIMGFYYLKFLTDVVLISPILAGVVVFASRAWDAVSDPVMGIISDRTRTRFGRRRPFFLAGVVLIFLSFFLLWYPVNFDKEMHRFIYMLLAYIFFSTVITMVMVPYNALAPELTPDYNERSSLMSIRLFFSQFSSLVCAVVPMEIIKAFPEDEKKGYVVMAIVIGLFFAIPFIATFFSTSEKEQFRKDLPPINVKKTFTEPFKTPTFVHVLFMYLFAFVAMDIVMTVTTYYMDYYLKRGPETDYVLGVLVVLQVIALPIFYSLSKKVGKKKTYLAAAGSWALFMFFGFLVTDQAHISFIYIFAGLVGFGTGGLILAVYSIFTDVPDVDELYSGERREGLYSSLFTFLRKMSTALGILILSVVMQVAGFVKPVEKMINGKLVTIKQAQSPEFLMALRVLIVVLPIFFLIAAIYNARRFSLTPELHGRLKDHLDKVRDNPENRKDHEEESRTIKDMLRG